MRSTRLVTLVAALAFTASGCAVVRFLAGAPPARTAGRSSALLARRCTGCHEVPDPASMSGAAWQAPLERMQQRIVLPSSEWDSLAAMAPVDVRR